MWKLIDFNAESRKEKKIDEKAYYFLFSTNKSSLLRKLQEAKSRKKK